MNPSETTGRGPITPHATRSQEHISLQQEDQKPSDLYHRSPQEETGAQNLRSQHNSLMLILAVAIPRTLTQLYPGPFFPFPFRPHSPPLPWPFRPLSPPPLLPIPCRCHPFPSYQSGVTTRPTPQYFDVHQYVDTKLKIVTFTFYLNLLDILNCSCT